MAVGSKTTDRLGLKIECEPVSVVRQSRQIVFREPQTLRVRSVLGEHGVFGRQQRAIPVGIDRQFVVTIRFVGRN